VTFFSQYQFILPQALPRLVDGVKMTIAVTIVALALSLILGLLVALLRMAAWRSVRSFMSIYVDLMRGTPGLTVLFIIYFGLSEFGLRLSPFQAAVLGLGVSGAAYTAEIYRAGIEAIEHGQMEAGLAIGMPPLSVMRYIVLPQAVRVIIPPVANFGIGLLKFSSIVSAIGVTELTYTGRSLGLNTLWSVHAMLLVAGLYLALSLPLAYVSTRLELRLGRYVRRA
jgi:polar amino acid transport system permease protein/cystine transport system permease protein